MSQAQGRRLRRGPGSAALALLDRAKRRGTPLIEDGAATFVWQGPRAPELVGDMTGWSPIAGYRSALRFQEAALDIWSLTVPFEPDAYLEYALQVDGEHRLDPLNKRTVPNGFGGTNNFFHMPEAPRSPLFRRGPGVARGRIWRRSLRSRHLIGEGPRQTWLYRPPVEGPVPVLAVLDGRDYFRRAQMPALLDNLIAAGTIAPIATVFVDNAGPDRVSEYMRAAGLDRWIQAFQEEILPWAAKRVDVTTEAGAHGVLGSSASGFASLWLGFHHPETFGRVFCQAGGFGVSAVHPPDLIGRVREGERRPIQVFLDCGTYDFLIEGNRATRDLLQGKGYPLAYQEFHAGHNYPAWREELAAGLAWLFPPKSAAG